MANSVDANSLDWQKVSGLMPAIIQDASTKTVLMLGYMNAEALEKTQTNGLVTFYSRTKKTLWLKGETSGNTLEVVSIEADCDNDTLLISAKQNGPTCHLGDDTCFGNINVSGAEWLSELENVIKNRINAPTEESYSARLLESGIKRIAQKVGEEGVEVALAGALGDYDELIEESSDLLYHLILLLVAKQKSIDDVILCLKDRHLEKTAS